MERGISWEADSRSATRAIVPFFEFEGFFTWELRSSGTAHSE